MSLTRKVSIIVILALSILTRFLFWGHPNQVVFDEVHYGKYVSGYVTGEHFFDVHPPLGKLILYTFSNLSEYDGSFPFNEIGDEYPNNDYQLMRLAPTISGILLPLIVFFLASKLGLGIIPSTLAGLATVLDNSLLVQSRFILIDIFIPFWGLLSLYQYLKFRDNRKFKYLIHASIFAGLALSTKWTGLAFPALWVLIELIDFIKKKEFFNRKTIIFLLTPAIIIFGIYYSTFIIHFKLLPNPGSGDAFVTQEFNQKNDFKKFLELNTQLYFAHERITEYHSYQSSWLSWPLMTNPIFYWVDEGQKIYYLGNPIVWYLATFSILLLILRSLRERKDYLIRFIIIGGFLANLLPFAGIDRTLFIYHYIGAYPFAILAIAYLFKDSVRDKNKMKILLATILIFITSFIYFSPLSYGLELTPREFNERMWLRSWE